MDPRALGVDPLDRPARRLRPGGARLLRLGGQAHRIAEEGRRGAHRPPRRRGALARPRRGAPLPEGRRGRHRVRHRRRGRRLLPLRQRQVVLVMARARPLRALQRGARPPRGHNEGRQLASQEAAGRGVVALRAGDQGAQAGALRRRRALPDLQPRREGRGAPRRAQAGLRREAHAPRRRQRRDREGAVVLGLGAWEDVRGNALGAGSEAPRGRNRSRHPPKPRIRLVVGRDPRSFFGSRFEPALPPRDRSSPEGARARP